MRRFALAAAALVATALVVWSCGGDLWSYDMDASTGSTAAGGFEAGLPEASAGQSAPDARANEEANAPPESGAPGQGCPPPDAGFRACVPCGNDDDCTKSATAQQAGFFACGVEKRCVQCTSSLNTCQVTNTGPQICVDEHCVTPCMSTAVCPGKAFCSVDRNDEFGAFDAGFTTGFSGSDAGFCLQCGLGGNGDCMPPMCNADQICVDCTDGGCGMGGTCSQNGYCVGLAPRDGG